MRLRLFLVPAIAVSAAALGVGAGALLWAGGDGDGARAVRTGPEPPAALTAAQRAARRSDPSNGRLFVLESSRGWVERVADRRWILHLERPRVLWFADRPARASGTMTAAKLVDVWRDAFAGSPPNGALTAPDAPDGPRPTALVVSPPTVRGADVSFPVLADRGMTAEGVAWLSGLTRSASARTGGVSFFVDDEGIDLTVTTTYTLDWRADLSQCAGYGNTSRVDAADVHVSYQYFDTGKCAFERTYARFDIIDAKGTKLGTVTFDGDYDGVQCTNADVLDCSSTFLGNENGYPLWSYWINTWDQTNTDP